MSLFAGGFSSLLVLYSGLLSRYLFYFSTVVRAPTKGGGEGGECTGRPSKQKIGKPSLCPRRRIRARTHHYMQHQYTLFWHS